MQATFNGSTGGSKRSFKKLVIVVTKLNYRNLVSLLERFYLVNSCALK